MALTKITTSLVAVNSLTSANIADNSIDATKIANNQILARHIAAGSISDQLAAAQPTITSVGTLTGLTIEAATARSYITSTGAGNNVALVLQADSADTTAENGGVYYVADNTADSSHLSLSGDNANYHFSVTHGGKVGIGTASPSGTLEVRSAQITDQYDRDSFLRLHPSAHTNSGGFTNIMFGTSTTNNYGVAIGGLRAGTDDAPSFSIRMLNDSVTGTEVMRITSAGKVGIGATPTYHFDVNNVAEDDDLYMSLKCDNSRQANIFFSDQDANYPGYLGYSHSSNAMIFATASSGNGSERMRIDSGGHVGINMGTNTTAIADHFLSIGTGSSNGTIGSEGFVHIGPKPGATDRNTDGYISGISLGYGENNDSYKHAGIAARAHGDGAARRDMVFLVNSTSEAASAELGDAKLTISSGTGTVSGDLNDTSDLGFKENVADLGNTLSIVKQLKPRTFTWKDEKAARGDSVGFIAQEVKAVVSDNTLVTGEEYDPDNLKMTGLSLNTVGLVSYLTKAIQELSANNDALEARIKTLEDA